MFTEKFIICSLLGILLMHPYMLQLAVSSTNFTDQSALLAIKSSISNTAIAGNWTNTTSFCNWTGVSCSRRRQRVTALNLSSLGLQGTISPHVANLSFLVSLDLSHNGFHGFLPHEIKHLFRLRILKVQHNNLQGTIPPSLCHCLKLQLLNLTANQFGGVIPNELGMLPKLRILFLSLNTLMGSIPASLGNISTLQHLDLLNTSLTGSLPLVIFNISSLKRINLSDNNISGSLPADLCYNCPHVKEILFSRNQFSGQLPRKIYRCSELVVLSLSDNRFEGSIPREVGSLQKLEVLYLGRNQLTGMIPSTIANMTRLRMLDLGRNSIEGRIPRDLERLSVLQQLNLQLNNLTGVIPPKLFNISSLRLFSLAGNMLSGKIPVGALPKVEILLLAMNQLIGKIPSYFSNFSNLIQLDMGMNFLTGPIPTGLGNLKFLKYLALYDNLLTGETHNPELGFLTALTNCSYLEKLHVDGNFLKGSIPKSIGNFSSSLQFFVASGNQIMGQIPEEIGSLRNLTLIDLGINNLNGTMPSTIGRLEKLQRLYLYGNNIEGVIPIELCQLRNLGYLYVHINKISGSIPNCIGNLSRLQILSASSNRLTSPIPVDLWGLENLLSLNLSVNYLRGDLTANISKYNVLEYLDLSWNQISGNVPSILGAFESLNSLNLSRNSFEGPIPQSLGNLKGLEFLDLSFNNLSGTIPNSLEALSFLRNLNLSFNKLSGEIPTGGQFQNFTAQSFLENRALCGRPIFRVPPCPRQGDEESQTEKIFLQYVIPVTGFLIICVAVLYMLRKYQENKVHAPTSTYLLSDFEHRVVSYQEIRRATNEFCESNFLGEGSYGSVYKGILSDGTIVAVKVLNLQLEGAFKSFDAECKVLRMTRHRNLVKVISSCSNPELRALVLQYMHKGSLEKWLYSHNYCLDLHQRLSIMVDVASALEYLHHGQAEPVIHCDLKPSNILLDDNMVAHVGDFGIAKILLENKDASQTRTLGTLGYIAPEYGFEGKVSAKGDVYSYGIMLLEIITRKKPTDEMFASELSLRQWVNASVPSNVMGVVDHGLLSLEEERDVNSTKAILVSIMEVGLECSKELPDERMDMKQVGTKLNKIKTELAD